MAPSQRAAAADQSAALAYAGLQLRIVAFILDIMVLISFGMLFGAGIGAYLVVDSHLNDGNLSDRAPYVAVALILAYVLAFVPLYHIVLWSRWGQTVGKMGLYGPHQVEYCFRITKQKDGFPRGKGQIVPHTYP